MATSGHSHNPGIELNKKGNDTFVAPKCEAHSDMVIQFWCITCKIRVCLTCFEEGHDEHSLKPFKKYVKEEVAFHLEVSDAKLQRLYERSGKLISRFENRINQSKEQKAYLLDERRRIDSLKGDLPKLKKFAENPKFDVNIDVIEGALKQWSRIDTFQQVVSVAEKEFQIQPAEHVLKFSKIKVLPINPGNMFYNSYNYNCCECGQRQNGSDINETDMVYHQNHCFTIQIMINENLDFEYVITWSPVDEQPKDFSFSGSVELKFPNVPQNTKKFLFEGNSKNTTYITVNNWESLESPAEGAPGNPLFGPPRQLNQTKRFPVKGSCLRKAPNIFNLESLGFAHGDKMSINFEIELKAERNVTDNDQPVSKILPIGSN